MAKITTISNNVTSSYQKDNISTLVPTSTLSTLSTSILPKTFGDQLPNIPKYKINTPDNNSSIGYLYKEKIDLIQEGIQLDIEHQLTLQRLKKDNTPSKKVVNGEVIDIPPTLDNEEYQKLVEVENINYNISKEKLKIKKEQNQKNIDDFKKDPFKKQKEAKKKRKEARSKQKNNIRTEKRKSKKTRIKSVLKSNKKTLASTLILLLTNKIADIISQNNKIGQLVKDTNIIIEEANNSNDTQKLNNAKIVRDNAIKIIQNNEDKLIKINQQIKNISIYINIFSIIVEIISSIPVPTAVPPGIGVPINLIMKLVKILDKANRILLSLSAFLPSIINILEKSIEILEDYKRQLLNINGILEVASVNSDSGKNLLSGNQFGTDFEQYKGFKFAIREDNDPKFIIRGNKRHYAVAIDTNNVEVLKSEKSYTLDPEDLISTLKLIIDKENLIA